MKALTAAQKKKLKDIRSKQRDFYECHPYEVKKNGIVRMGAKVFEDVKWLLDLIDGKATDDSPVVPEADGVEVEEPVEV